MTRKRAPADLVPYFIVLYVPTRHERIQGTRMRLLRGQEEQSLAAAAHSVLSGKPDLSVLPLYQTCGTNWLLAKSVLRIGSRNLYIRKIDDQAAGTLWNLQLCTFGKWAAACRTLWENARLSRVNTNATAQSLFAVSFRHRNTDVRRSSVSSALTL